MENENKNLEFECKSSGYDTDNSLNSPDVSYNTDSSNDSGSSLNSPDNSYNTDSSNDSVSSYNMTADTPENDRHSDVYNTQSQPNKGAFSETIGDKYTYSEVIYTTPENAAGEPVKPGHPVNKFFKLIGSAALFGIIAGGTFLGVNKVYEHFNSDEASPSAAADTGSSNDEVLLLDKPTTDITIQTSTVVPGSMVVQPDVSSVIEQVMPSTVSIVSTFTSTSYFFGQPYSQESEGSGSGIIIGENDEEYLIATNNHVVENASSISITFIDDSVYTAYLKGNDTSNDLAVIAVKKSDLSDETIASITVAKLGDSDSTKVGEMVVAIGNALGYGQSCTVGYISAKDREITSTNSSTGTKNTLTVLQTDAAINPGNSGGALVNMNGEVIGINSAKLSATSVEGIGYAIPISYAIPIVSDLMTREVIADEDKGYLGIYMEDVTSSFAEAYGWPVGVYVSDIVEGSPAETAGILKGDIITGVNETECTNRVDLKNKVTSYKYGTTISITLQRYEDGAFKEYTIDVTLAKASDVISSGSENTSDGSSASPDGSASGTPSESENGSGNFNSEMPSESENGSGSSSKPETGKKPGQNR